MASTSLTKTYTTIVTDTLEGFLTEELQDQVIDESAAMAWLFGRDLKELQQYRLASDIPSDQLREKTAIKEVEGNVINVPVRWRRTNTVKFIPSTGKLSTVTADPHTTAQAQWKILAGSVTVSEAEVAKNLGSEVQIIDYTQGLVEDLKESFANYFAVALFSDGSIDNGDAITGLQALCSDVPAVGTVMQINRANETWWRNNATDGGAVALTEAHVRTMFNTCSRGKMHPTFLVMDQTRYEAFEAFLTANARYEMSENAQMAQLGFNHFTYKGAIVTWDRNCPAGSVYFLTKKGIKLAINPHMKFHMREWVNEINGLSKVGIAVLMCELVTTNPRLLGVRFNVG